VETLIVLGAGASAGAQRYPIESSLRQRYSKLPLSRGFFYDLFREGARGSETDRFLNMLGLMYEGTNNLITHAWAMEKNAEAFEPEEWKDVDIEEVLTFLDVGSRMYFPGSRYRRVFSIARRSLIDFIRLNIMVRCDSQHCEHLRDILCRLKPEDSVISFNYDTLADVTLEHFKFAQYKAYCELLSGQRPKIRAYRGRGVLLKLHGSGNWVACSNRECEQYSVPHIPFPKRSNRLPRIGDSGFGKCVFCGTEGPEAVIVPPVTEKLLNRNAFLRSLWLIARDKIASAERIVFIGYSFPIGDVYSEWLFRQIHFLEGEKPELVVVNPEIYKPRSSVSQRYRTIFKGCEIVRCPSLAEYACATPHRE
jgi:hypothetical protein